MQVFSKFLQNKTGPASVAAATVVRQTMWVGLASLAWSMLFVWQGLDFTDMGFWLTGYQQHYTHPDVISGGCWLSNLIGHWTGVVMGGGVLGYKLGYVLVITASAMITHHMLASRFGPCSWLVTVVLVTVAFSRVFGGNWVGYNDLTALFYLAGSALLFHGLVHDRRMLILMSGMVLGANLFVRLPNVLGVALVSAVWLQAWTGRWPLRKTAVGSACFLGGFLLGAGLVWGLIVLHGHQAVYIQGVQALLEKSNDSKSSHSGSGLLGQFLKDHWRALRKGGLLVVLGGGLAIWAGRRGITWSSMICLVGSLVLAGLFWNRSQWRSFIPGVCYLVLVAVMILEFRKERETALLALLALLVLLLVPIGSNNGITNAVYGIWLALPVTLLWLWRSSGFTIGGFSIDPGGIKCFALTLAAGLLFFSLLSAWRYTYLDSNNRFSMKSRVEHPLLSGVRTTRQRAGVVQDLLDAMPRYIRPGDEVLAYNAVPLVHYLTATHPWLGNPWPDFSSPNKITALLREKEQDAVPLPCIVRATQSTYTTTWPSSPRPLSTWQRQDEVRKVFAEFEQRNGYVVAWSNTCFQILTPAR